MLERDNSEIGQRCIKGGEPKSVIVGVVQKGSRYLMGTHLVEGCRALYLVSLTEESNLAPKMARKTVMMVDTHAKECPNLYEHLHTTKRFVETAMTEPENNVRRWVLMRVNPINLIARRLYRVDLCTDKFGRRLADLVASHGSMSFRKLCEAGRL